MTAGMNLTIYELLIPRRLREDVAFLTLFIR